MPRPDEGLIHAWLDGELDAAEAARVARLVETDAEWGAAAAEARGVIAASSRIVKALDVVPAGVIPSFSGAKAGGAPVKRTLVRPWLRIAATIVLVAGVGYVATESRELEGDLTVSAAPLRDTSAPAAEAVAPSVVPVTTPTAPPAVSPALGRSGGAGARQEAAKSTAANDLAAASVLAQDSAPTITPPPRSAVTARAPSTASGLAAPPAAPEPTAAPRPAELRERAEAAAAARASAQPQAAQLRPRQITDREPSALGAASDALTERVIPGCWRTRTTARGDTLLVDPRIMSVVRDSLVILLSPIPLDARTLTSEAPPRATVVRVGLTTLRGTARTTDGAVVPFEATRTTCP